MSYSKQTGLGNTLVEDKPQEPFIASMDTRGMLSLVTMLVSMGALTVSMAGAAKLVVDVFNEGLANNLNGIAIKLAVLSLSFLFGWGVGLVCIRVFGNLVYPFIVRVYAWASVIAVGILYIKIIQKLYGQNYDTLHFWTYLVMLFGGLCVLVGLHLMVEDHDLRPFAIPLLIISVVQLFAIVWRYVFAADPNGWMLFGDFAIFGVMISISALMLMHIGILAPIRGQINEWFFRNMYKSGNGEAE